MNAESHRNPWPEDRRSWLWLGLAVPLLLVANGGHILPAAVWLAPVFLLRFLRTQPAVRGMVAAAVVSILVFAVAWRGLVPVPDRIYPVLAVVFGLLLSIPYLVDRLLAPHVHGFRGTLVFPLAWVAMEYATSLLSPYGTWGAAAYTQFGNLPLLQIVAITGIFGIAFLIGWFAAIVNWVWEQDGVWSRVRGGVLGYAGVLACVLVYGAARLAFAPGRADTVRLATVTADRDDPALVRLWSTPRFGAELSDDEIAAVRDATHAVHDNLFALTRREARAGARLVAWSECNGVVLREDEATLVERGRTTAREEGVYLFMALASIERGQPLAENKVVMIDPTGEVVDTYLKSIPVPREPSVPGPGRLSVIDTPFGRVATAICFDMDFRFLIRQAGIANADIIVVPSSDWAEIDPLHTYMALVRGIENGMTVVRQTNRGLSAAADHQGHILASMDHFTTPTDRVMVTQAPTRGVATVYARVGDVFTWACLAGLAGLLATAVARRRSLATAPNLPALSGAEASAGFQT